jgi:hypothetical protein
MKEFSLYDMLGVLAPGAVVTVGIITLFPEAAAVLANKSFTVGEFGIVLLASYVLGNLVAGLGNFLESAYWKIRGGHPTDSAIRSGCDLIHTREQKALQERLQANRFIGADECLADLAPRDWKGLTRRMYIELENRKATRRIDLFNAQYGMNRGIAAGFIALVALVIFNAGLAAWRIELILAACTALACYRMERFSRYYTGELLRGYITVGEQTKSREPDPTQP